MKSIERIRDSVVFVVKYRSEYTDSPDFEKRVTSEFTDLWVWNDSFQLSINDGNSSEEIWIKLSFNSDCERYKIRWITAAKLLDIPIHDWVTESEKQKILRIAALKVVDADSDDDLQNAIIDLSNALHILADDKMERTPKFTESEICQMDVAELKRWVREL